ncbi:MAG: enoyl-ACP reductase [Clostridia bacterium]|nr:enoyl-ACP reductase [Clostridia bacterium]
MIVKNKKILIMGIRNKWSIAWGVAKRAYENGAEIIFTYSSMEKADKIEELIAEIPGSKAYVCDAQSDENIADCLENIKKDYGRIDGILHSIAHANTEDLRNDFILTSRDGFAHASDISAYSLVAITRIAVEKELLNEGASIIALTYYGSEKSIVGYNVMGVAKAALEASIRYLACDLGKKKMRINAISAGPIKTLSAKGIKDFGSILDIVEEKAPLHENVTTDEIGSVATFLFSDMSKAITGEVIHADKGFSSVAV